MTDLLQRLAFTPITEDEVAAKELEAFAKANRAELRGLGVDLASFARKSLMPM